MMGVSDIQCTPILAIDLWEHAYWGDHDGEVSTTYIQSFLNNIKWDSVSQNYEAFNKTNQVAPII